MLSEGTFRNNEMKSRGTVLSNVLSFISHFQHKLLFPFTKTCWETVGALMGCKGNALSRILLMPKVSHTLFEAKTDRTGVWCEGVNGFLLPYMVVLIMAQRNRLKTRQSRFRKQLVRVLEQADNSVIGHLVMNSDRNKTMCCIQMYRLTNNVYVTNLTHMYLLELVLGGAADTECWRSCCRSSFSSRNSRCSILYKQGWRNLSELKNVKTEE